MHDKPCAGTDCDVAERPVQWRYYANPSFDTVMVLFQGIFGDPLKTWTYRDTATSFPHLIAVDITLNRPGVFLVGYDSPLFARAMTQQWWAFGFPVRCSIWTARDEVVEPHRLGGCVTLRNLTRRHAAHCRADQPIRREITSRGAPARCAADRNVRCTPAA